TYTDTLSILLLFISVTSVCSGWKIGQGGGPGCTCKQKNTESKAAEELKPSQFNSIQVEPPEPSDHETEVRFSKGLGLERKHRIVKISQRGWNKGRKDEFVKQLLLLLLIREGKCFHKHELFKKRIILFL
uniref:Uncharacterized protein n=1 Tax=Poecilia mexicana TaxID=48701 RepID=A0A3B3WJH3_9TELE